MPPTDTHTNTPQHQELKQGCIINKHTRTYMHTQYMLYDLIDCIDDFLRRYHVLNFLLALLRNLPPAHNRIITYFIFYTQPVSHSYLISTFSRSLSYCVPHQAPAASASASTPAFPCMPLFSPLPVQNEQRLPLQNGRVL